ncbi:unnamed protein product [Pylaiella littoralis]
MQKGVPLRTNIEYLLIGGPPTSDTAAVPHYHNHTPDETSIVQQRHRRRHPTSSIMSRIVRFLGRTKAYFMECKQNMAPQPNPEWYEEKNDTRVTLKNLRKLPLSVHAEVWSSTWKWYAGSFEESFAWGRRRKEEARKKAAREKMDGLQGMIEEARVATHNTPEDIENSKKALKELLEEIHDNRDELKSAAQEKLDLIRVSLSEFSTGYREARDEEITRVMAMDKSALQAFLHDRAGEVKHATSIITDAILEKDSNNDRSSTSSSRGKTNRNPSAPASTTTAAAATSDASPPTTDDDDGGRGDADSGPSRFLSQQTRQAVDDFLEDPDVERLTGRAKGFARERLLQAEAAARVLKGTDGDDDDDDDGDGSASQRQQQQQQQQSGDRRKGRRGPRLRERWSTTTLGKLR